jgi:hypothetical protein
VAAIKAVELPVNLVAALANRSKKLFFLVSALDFLITDCLLKYTIKQTKAP